MDAPPKPKSPTSKETPEGLAEVERALSVLQGRHPETERLRREDEVRRRERQAKEAAVVSGEARRVRSRRLRVGAAASAAVIVAIVITLIFRGELSRRATLERATDPYRAMGFVIVESVSRAAPVKIEADVPAGCLVATSTGNARVQLIHPGAKVEGPSPLITCVCDPSHVTLTSDAKTEDGLALLRADAPTVGGSHAFPFLPFKPGATGRGDAACAEASLDAWLDAKRSQAPNGDGKRTMATPASGVDGATSNAWFAREPSRAKLRDLGFVVSAVVAASAPFTTVDVPASSCLLALVGNGQADKPAIRLRGGAFAVGPASGGVAWCTANETTVVAQRDAGASSGGEIAVLTVPAARVGGLVGVREVAERAGIAVGAAAVPAADYGWSAKNLLVASAIPEHLITIANTPELGRDNEARIVALAVARPGMIAADLPADVFSFCDPALESATGPVCVFSGAQKWRVQGAEAMGGIARSKLPFWLFALQGIGEPIVLKIETQLIALARRLRREGFEPTTIEAVTELDKGAEVLGRANEDAMVAFALAPSAPWVMPYTDGPAWTLDGEPRVVPIKPLERVTVVSPLKTLPPKATRRTVVFRRTRH